MASALRSIGRFSLGGSHRNPRPPTPSALNLALGIATSGTPAVIALADRPPPTDHPSPPPALGRKRAPCRPP